MRCVIAFHGWVSRQTELDASSSHLLTESAQTEDGHAMMKFDTFQLTPELEPRSAWMSQNGQQMRANLRACVCVSQQTSGEVIS